jgi:hypothetical protein
MESSERLNSGLCAARWLQMTSAETRMKNIFFEARSSYANITESGVILFQFFEWPCLKNSVEITSV